MEIICSLRFKKFKQSVNKNTSSVCIYLERDFINTNQASLSISLGPLALLWPSRHFVCIGVTVLLVILHAVWKSLSVTALLPEQVLHVAPKYLSCSWWPRNCLRPCWCLCTCIHFYFDGEKLRFIKFLMSRDEFNLFLNEILTIVSFFSFFFFFLNKAKTRPFWKDFKLECKFQTC